MNLKSRFQQIQQYIQRKWFNIALIVLACLLVLNKDLSIRFNIKAPLNKEKTSIPGTKLPEQEDAKSKKPSKVTQSLGAKAPQTKSQGLIGDAFNLFTPPSIPEESAPITNSDSYEISSVSEAEIASFVKRFGDVAKNEMKKYKVPASIILAQALIGSHAGVNQVAKSGNNFFNLKCSGNWEGPTISYSGVCYRKYETAWFSFRDHSVFITSGQFRHLTNLDSKDYVRWAKGLELAGFNSSSGYSETLISTIKTLNLDRFDQG
ncbi:MAG: glucosaminidase domain-containing protein [Bacteroidota bacterium]